MDGAEGAWVAAAPGLLSLLITHRGDLFGGLLRGGGACDRQRGGWCSGATCLRADQASAGRGVLA
eukprot:8013888-Alexandrium_andersonii.AAC.1